MWGLRATPRRWPTACGTLPPDWRAQLRPRLSRLAVSPARSAGHPQRPASPRQTGQPHLGTAVDREGAAHPGGPDPGNTRLLVQATPCRPGRLPGPERPGASAAGSSLGRTPSPWTPSCCLRPIEGSLAAAPAWSRGSPCRIRLTGAVLTLVLPADQVRTTGRGPSQGGRCPWPEERGERGQRREVPLRLRTSFASSSPSSSRPSAFSFFHLNSSRS